MSKKRRKQLESRLLTFFTTLSDDLNASPYCDKPAVQRQLHRMRKRAEIHKPEHREAAIENFKNLNDAVGSINRDHQFDEGLLADMRDFITHVLERFTKRIDPESLQECISWSWIVNNWAFGPGTSNGCEGTGVVQKIDEPMTCTRSAESIVKLIRKTTPYFLAFDSRNGRSGVLEVDGSRLTTVLKSEDAERTIAIEPSGNMAVQLAGGRYLEGVLRMIGCNLSTQQDLNRRLALLYSRGGGGTIDLKSASDMFSIRFVQLAWPAQWFDFFMRFRSPVTDMVDGSRVKLEMVSTMGNGFTFPMITLTLIALIYASRRRRGGPWRYIDLKATAVFGDDIIVPTADYDDVIQALRSCGLVVNTDKSYNEGPFRESCGGDYYEGENITPFYVRRLTDSASIYVAINQLLSWAGQHEICVVRAYRYLVSLLGGRVFFVPEWFGPTAGIQCQRVAPKFHYLGVSPQMFPYTGAFEMSLACGGYLVSAKDGAVYQPRTDRVVYHSRKARLPRGYLDGWDPLTRSLRQSSYVQLLIELGK